MVEAARCGLRRVGTDEIRSSPASRRSGELDWKVSIAHGERMSRRAARLAQVVKSLANFADLRLPPKERELRQRLTCSSPR